ncbi:MAG: hypothetical protein QOF78_261, partial [Phycisphaerales bacterium]|nr:hypothetical protein [Phycisphaerales bacterium]
MKNKREIRRRRLITAVAATATACALIPTDARAVAIQWTSPAGGNFNDIGNWNSGAGPVPAGGDDAQFNLANAYTTVFTNNVSTAATTIGGGGSVSFATDGVARTLTTGLTTINPGSLTLAAPTGAGGGTLAMSISNQLLVKGGGSMLITGGNDITSVVGGLSIGTVAGPTNGAVGSLILDGAGSSVATTNSTFVGNSTAVGELILANNATASLGGLFTQNSTSRFSGAHITVASGADLSFGGTAGYVQLATFGGHALQSNSLTVTGPGSTLTQSNGFFTLGGGAAPILFTINDGGVVTTAQAGYTLSVNTNATLDFTGGTLNARGAINVGGGIFRRSDTTGILNWPDGFKGYSVTAGGLIDWDGAMNLSAPGSPFTINVPISGTNSKLVTSGALTVGERVSVSVGAGGLLLSPSLTVGGPNGVPAVVTLDGAGAVLDTGAGTFGGTGSYATLAFKNGADGSFAGTLSLPSNVTASIESDADVTAANISIGGASGSAAVLTVTGAGSTLVQSSASTLSVVQGAVLIVNSSAALTTGTGTTTLSNGGNLNANGGTLNVLGNVSVANSTLQGLTTWANGRSMSVTSGAVIAPLDLLGLSGNTISVSGVGAQFSARDVAFNGGTTALFSGGGRGQYRTFRIGSDGTAGIVTIDGSGRLITSASALASTIGAAAGGAAALNIVNGAEWTSADATAAVVKPTGVVNIASNKVHIGSLAVDGGRVNVNSGAVSLGAGFSVINGGVVQMSDQAKLIVRGGTLGTSDGATYSGVSGLIQSGSAGGAWNGPGVNTNMPDAASGLTALGVALADDVGYVGGTFGGTTIASGDVLVMYTYGGDANLDGMISGDDYSAIDFNIGVANAGGWNNGDFN